MLAKMGRPKAENPREIKFTFRMNKEENEMLEELCVITGENRNQSIRTAVIKYYEYLMSNTKK